MNDKPPVVLALDIATTTGVAIGRIDRRTPDVFTWNMREGGPGRALRLSWFLHTLSEFFAQTHVDIVRYEEPMPVAVATRIGTSQDTVLLLYGAVAILEVAACRARIFDTNSFSVADARRHLLGQRPPKGEGKNEVLKMVRVLGVDTEDHNSADAAAGWFLAAAQLNPAAAYRTSPLFAKT